MVRHGKAWGGVHRDASNSNQNMKRLLSIREYRRSDRTVMSAVENVPCLVDDNVNP